MIASVVIHQLLSFEPIMKNPSVVEICFDEFLFYILIKWTPLLVSIKHGLYPNEISLIQFFNHDLINLHYREGEVYHIKNNLIMYKK